jgi:hypothetical protein
VHLVRGVVPSLDAAVTGTRWRVPSGKERLEGGSARGMGQLGAAALPRQGAQGGLSRNPGPETTQRREADGECIRSLLPLELRATPPGGEAQQEQTWDGAGPGVQVSGAVDAWEDAALLSVLQGRGYPPGCGRGEQDRLQHRAWQYLWQEGHLVRRLADGSIVE